MTATVSHTASLSHGDERILNSVFDPENYPDTPTVTIDESLPQDPHITDSTLLKRLRNRELDAIRMVEQSSLSSSSQPNSLSLNSSEPTEPCVKPSEDKEKQVAYLQALEVLSSLIKDQPKYASAYNNRAQLRRWRYGPSLLKAKDAETHQALDAVIDDLDTAIQTASPSSTTSAVSPAQAKLLSQAWTQRGAVLWGLSKTATAGKPSRQQDDGTRNPVVTSQERTAGGWRSWDAARLEEEGSRSFFMAGMYGSEIGRTMAVKTNPYARLCAGIVKEAMRSEYGG